MVFLITKIDESMYFGFMLKAEEERRTVNGGLKDSFIRGNENAELENGIGHHRDTEYHYSIKDEVLTAYQIVYGSDELEDMIFENRSWKAFYIGSVEGFVKEYK